MSFGKSNWRHSLSPDYLNTNSFLQIFFLETKTKINEKFDTWPTIIWLFLMINWHENERVWYLSPFDSARGRLRWKKIGPDKTKSIYWMKPINVCLSSAEISACHLQQSFSRWVDFPFLSQVYMFVSFFIFLTALFLAFMFLCCFHDSLFL